MKKNNFLSILYFVLLILLTTEEIKAEILSATVISNSCVESGVYTTSLMVDKNIKTKHVKYLINENLEIVQ